jgi:predicted Zn-dependent protease
MMRAKLRGYIQRPEVTLRQYPVADNGKPARYARAMAYFREPDMQKALGEIQSLLKDEPNNPYFLEMYGQIKVDMGKVEEGIEPYRHAVKILPDATLIHIALAAALLGSENRQYTGEAIQELQTALAQDSDDALAWYELATAYGRMGQTGKPNSPPRNAILWLRHSLRRCNLPGARSGSCPGFNRLATRNRYHRHRADPAEGRKGKRPLIWQSKNP